MGWSLITCLSVRRCRLSVRVWLAIAPGLYLCVITLLLRLYLSDSRDTLQAATIRPSEAVSSVQTARSAQAGSAEATHHGVELAELQAKLEEALGDCNEARRDARMAREQAKDFLAQVEKAWEEVGQRKLSSHCDTESTVVFIMPMGAGGEFIVWSYCC